MAERRVVPLYFYLEEDVTPAIFASKVADACALSALRPGESVGVNPHYALFDIVEAGTRQTPDPHA